MAQDQKPASKTKLPRGRRIKNQLRQAKEQYQSLFENMNEGFAFCKMLYDDKGCPNDFLYLETNRAFERLTGLISVVGKKVTQVIPGVREAHPELFELYSRVAETGRAEKFEVYFKPLSSWLAISVYSPEKGYFAAVFDNITERKRADETLLQQRRDLLRAQSVANMGSWRVITGNNELLWSEQTYKIFGLERGMPMTYERFLEYVFPADRDFVNKSWQEALQGKKYDIEHRIVVNGGIKWVRETAELEFRDGVLVSGFGTVQDVTERQELQQRLKEKAAQVEEYACQMEDLAEQRLQELKQSERLAAIGQTAGMVGHDIRNPLHSIIGELYLLKEGMKELPKKEHLHTEFEESINSIEENIFYINKIVSDLQDFTKPLRPRLEEVTLRQIIDDIIKSTYIPENVKVLYQANESLHLNTDASFVRRILTNLMLNAVQAMPKGGCLTVHAYKKAEQLRLEVEDNGEGIPRDIQPKLFRPLYTTKSKGQGLGLAVVKRLVEALDGDITFESQEGKGTKFSIQLPLKGPEKRGFLTY